MKFLVDAQLPRSLVTFLRDNGFDAIHTSDLPLGNDTSDAEINSLSIAESRIVVTKDGDFYDSFADLKEPYKLLLIKTGNISNKKLIELFSNNLTAIIGELRDRDVITIDQRHIIALH